MTYRTPESLIRSIMSGTLNESVAADHMTPALKTDDAARLTGAVEVLKASGVSSAEIKDNAICVSPEQTMLASNVLDAAFQHGLITVKPMLSSPNAIEMPEPHVPAPEFAKEETVEEGAVNLKLPDQKDEDDQTPEAKVEADGTVELEPRSLRNRTENQVKKVDEEIEQVDELSKGTLSSYVDKAVSDVHNKGFKSGEGYAKGDMKGTAKHAIKSIKRQVNIGKAVKKIAKEETVVETPVVEEVLTELSYSKLKGYEKKGTDQVADAAKKNKLDKRIAQRASYVAKAKEKSTAKLKKAAFGEEVNPVGKIVSLCEALKLRETLHSESGDHHAKIYRDSEYGEHRVKYFPHGKHHEPADSFHSDHDDAHHTAKHELKRMDKLSGALKESSIDDLKASLNEEETDALSKVIIARHVRLAEVAEAGKNPFQLDEISGEKLDAYAEKADSNYRKAKKAGDTKTMAKRGRGEKSLDKRAHVCQDCGGSGKDHAGHNFAHSGGHEDCENCGGKGHIYHGLHEDIEQLDEIVKVGTYTNRFGHTLTMHRSPNDAKHHMLVHNGSVVKTHHGSAEDFHKKLTKDGFQGALHEEQINELSTSTLSKYVIKAASDKRDHVAKATSSFARGNAPKGEAQVKQAQHADAQKHSRKAINRHEGIKKASEKMAKKCETAGVCEDVEQIDELSNKTLNIYVSKSASDMVGHITKNPSAKLDNDKHLQKRHAGYQMAKKKIAARKPEQSFPGAIDGTRLKEEVELTEAKADAEKAKKALFKHPEADAIGKTMMGASKHFNYVQDAVDHVYNNHSKDLSYEDFDKIRPHLEDHFKKSGLK